MTNPSFPIVLFLSTVLLLSFFTFISANEPFLGCLHSNSNPKYPISSVIYSRSNSSYSSVLQTYIRNLRFNESTTQKPQLIITALHVSHIQAAVVCGKQHDMQMKIRSGGHDYEGLSYVSENPNFFVLDMFNLRAINVSEENETAWVQTGATLGEVYYRIAEKSNVHGFPAGVCPTVGVGGHMTGGGYGTMMRKYGLSVDNILDAQVVDVNGRFLDRASMGEDLFWAITGGGGSSFGVVVAFKIKLVRVPPKVTVFRVDKTYHQNAVNLAYKWQQIAYKLPDDLFIRMTLAVVNGSGIEGKTIMATFRALFLGDSTKLLPIMEKFYPELGVQQKDCIELTWVESIVYWTEFPNGTSIDALLSRVPQSLVYHKRKSDYLTKPMPKAGIELLFQKMVELESPFIQFNPYGGRMSQIPWFEKPYPHRAGYITKMQYSTEWNEGGAEAANRYKQLVRDLYNFMTPYVSKSPRQAFLNYRDIDLGVNHQGNRSYIEGAAFGRKYFKDNFDRLVKIKTNVDPDNFFRNEQSIPVHRS
ncbi:hypothetical protein M9H77_26929 [Catharanthus roseus]|uniref:Uncharacterized protein n=1 Tax=Catharanthus roseus TaxID=4058 RepID=A0ACC0ABJ7_CATRO|nr:hypothetical protein M9H77_26929 [Catharanthus roseus]